MSREIERRIIPSTVDVRAAADGAPAKLTGYAALYDSLSEDLGGFREIIRAGAFDRSLKGNPDILIRAEHDNRMLLGRTSAGTARVWADVKGLRYEVDLPDTQPAHDVQALCKRGDVRQSSFAFSLPDPENGQRWSKAADGYVLRELLDVDLHDCAPVAGPAYSETTVSARALEQAKALPAEAQRAAELVRFRAQRKAEKREAAFEDKLDAVWLALYAMLGSMWPETGPGWRIVATYSDRVIIETAPGRFFLYPLAFDAANGVTIVAPLAVEPQWLPIAADGERTAPPAEGGVIDPSIEIYRERLRMEELR